MKNSLELNLIEKEHALMLTVTNNDDKDHLIKHDYWWIPASLMITDSAGKEIQGHDKSAIIDKVGKAGDSITLKPREKYDVIFMLDKKESYFEILADRIVYQLPSGTYKVIASIQTEEFNPLLSNEIELVLE